MPDSFGRMKSHCFGCEGAFKGDQVQVVAEEIFTKRIGRDPFNPRVHYLLGYLRKEQGRYKEAAQSFQKAIELDADYINAYKNLLGIRYEAGLSEAETAGAQLQLLRIDPRGKHSSTSSFDGNLADVWKVIESIEPIAFPEAPKNVLKFAAFNEPESDDDDSMFVHSSISYDEMDDDGDIPTPSAVIFRHKILSAIKEAAE